MDREYLEDYEQKERAGYGRLLKSIREGKFNFEKDRFPSDERFVNLQNPVAFASHDSANISNLWAQIPFCGSLIFFLPPYSSSLFERVFFKIYEISKVIGFIKETGKLQVILSTMELREYEGLDHLDPFFKELEPSVCSGFPLSFIGKEKEIQKAVNAFVTGRLQCSTIKQRTSSMSWIFWDTETLETQ